MIIICKCDASVVIGNYKNQIEVPTPQHMLDIGKIGWYEFRETLCIDACLVKEIKYLWEKGIVTTGCCCGHNQVDGYIGVKEEFIPTMKEMGYGIVYNPLQPNSEDSFYPKSI